MSAQIRAIFWAQQRSLRRHLAGGRRLGAVLSGIVLVAWYAFWTALAAGCAVAVARPESLTLLGPYLPRLFFGLFLFWQLGPVLVGSQGAALDLKKLLAFPVPERQLFGIEVLLRLTTGLEGLLLAAGLTVGLTLNPKMAVKTAPAALALFLLFNLFLGAGLKYQIERLLNRKRVREVLVLLLVLLAALPQLLTRMPLPASLRGAGAFLWEPWWPWSTASRLAMGQAEPSAWLAALGWLALAWAYGRRQFERGLRREEASGDGGRSVAAPPGRSRLQAIYELPSRLFPDPLAAIVEKEIRTLVRSPRFRLLFLMGCTFGVLIFLPMLLKSRSDGTEAPSYQLAMVCGYALLLLGDVLFWNIFGLDRTATQFYFVQPRPMTAVIAAKNLTAAVFVLLEITGVVAVWGLLRLPLGAGRLAEAYAAPVVVCLYMMAAGNLTSAWYPRPVRPEKTSGAGSAATVRILLLLLLPVLSIPVLLAYLARYALNSQAAFWGMLGLAALGGVVFYRAAVKVAADKVHARQERFLETLSSDQGPIHLE